MEVATKRQASQSPVAKELNALRNKDGKLVIRDCHTWAKTHTRSALHAELEWDDRIAGEQHRYTQIRNLIQVHITDAVGTRKWISLSVDRSNGDGGGYRDMADVVRNKSLRSIMLGDALNDLDRLHRLYQPLQELEPIWSVVERLKQSLDDGGKAAA
jgi:hypothetical protein